MPKLSFKKQLKLLIKKIKNIDRVIWIVFALIIIFIFYFTLFAFTKQDNFLTGRFDLGNMDQVVWNTLHGRIFNFTNGSTNQVASRLSDHADFILILLSPFYLIWENPKMLLLIQTIVSGMGALFVYLFGKDVLRQRLIPFFLTVSFLFHPFLQRQNIFEFHPVVLATTFLLAAIYFLNKNKYLYFFVFLILAVLTKEHVYLIASLFGFYIYFFKKRNWGILLGLVSAFIFYLLVDKFIPDARGSSHLALSYYSYYGSSPLGMIQTFFTNPALTASVIIKNNVLDYYKNLFLPVGFLSLFSPLYLIFALPELVINSLSQFAPMRMYYYHYSATTIPFIYISSIFGVKKLLTKFPKSGLIISVFLVIAVLYSSYTEGPLFFAKDANNAIFVNSKNAKIINDYLKTIPEDISIASTNNLGAHLSHRKESYSLLTKEYLKAEYVLFLIRFNLKEDKYLKINLRELQFMLKNKDYKIIYKLDNFIVFQKKQK